MTVARQAFCIYPHAGGTRPARARPRRFGGEGVADTAGGDGAVTVVTASVTTRAASGALEGGEVVTRTRLACRALSHSRAAIRSASARRKAAPSRCWRSAAAHASTVAIASGHSRTCTGSFTTRPSRPGGGAIPHAFSQCYHVDHPMSRVAQHGHACNAMRGLLRSDSYANRSL